MGFKPNKEQEKAINFNGNCDILVSAGAGSGKTAVLSERVLHFIKDLNYSIGDFLILTFTKLAAGEMKDRIRSKLMANNLKDAEFVDVADITTFDGYCNSLVKKYHTVLNIEEGFTIVDSNVISVLKRRYIREELEKLYLDHNSVLEELATYWLEKDDGALEKLISKTIEKMNLTNDKEEFINNFIPKYYNEAKCDEMLNLIVRNIHEILSYMETRYDLIPDVFVESVGKNADEAAQDFIRELLDIDDYDLLIQKIVSEGFVQLPKRVGKNKDLFTDEEADSYSKFKKPYANIKSKVKEYKHRDEFLSDLLYDAKFAELVLSIAKTVDDRLMDYKLEHQAFEFADINKFAMELVTNPKFDYIRQELKAKYKMIMIDEYQDTNQIQEDFIARIKNNNAYYVGDVKQAIYGFRNATPKLFMQKFDSFPLYPNSMNLGDGTKITMDSNYRSRKPVIQDINAIFSMIMTKDYGGADYARDHIINYANHDYEVKTNDQKENHIDLLKYTCTGSYDFSKEISIMANDITKKINDGFLVNGVEEKEVDGEIKKVPTTRKCTFKDFAIIIDRGSRFESILKEFTKRKIPIFMEQDENLIKNDFIQILTNLIVVIKQIDLFETPNTEFKHAYISLIRSFLEKYENVNRDEYIYNLVKANGYLKDNLYLKIKDAILKNKDASNYIKIEKVIETLDVYNVISRLGNVEKNEVYLEFFLNTYKQMQDLDYSYEEFITYLNNLGEYELKLNLSSKGSDANAVKLINIHKSKGLEYGIVYFPGLNVQFPNFENKENLLISDDFGMIFRGKESAGKIAYGINKTINDISERTRLLYVALTRAKEKIICLIPQGEKIVEKPHIESTTFYDLIRDTLGQFHSINKDEEEDVVLDIKPSEGSEYAIDYLDLDFENTRVDNYSRASKEITFDINQDLLDYGNKLHFNMEVLDFKNPDYSFIKNPKERELAEAFLSSSLMKDVKEAKIYKEYEFVDQLNNTNGIIDLYLAYEDKIVIIDYKTKNILDEHYDEQLKVYYNFLIQKYPGKEIEMYLYSLIDKEFRKIEIS